MASYTNSVGFAFQGGTGGTGGNAVGGTANNFSGGGGGGGGGNGGVFGGTSFTNQGDLLGGAGGAGGLRGNNDGASNGGGGGRGGFGLYATNSAGIVISNEQGARIVGGDGGGATNSDKGAGAGGAGIYGASLTITNAGEIRGGVAGGGVAGVVQANAIDFTGGTNTLTSNGAASYTGAISIASGATLALDQTDAAGGTGSFTYANAFNGAGALSINTTLVRGVALSGVNTYTGGTTINDGLLDVSNGNALSDVGAVVLGNGADIELRISTSETIGSLSGGGSNAGTFNGVNIRPDQTLTINQSVSGVFAGHITGTGNFNLVKQGAATLTLTSTNNVGGSTTISAGTLQIGAGGTTGSLDSSIVDNAALVFNRFDNVTFSNTISGTGTVQKLGAGVLTLSGGSSYAGATFVDAGTLLVTGSPTGTGTITVAAAAALGGVGSVAGAVTVAGTFSAGAAALSDVGTLATRSLTLNTGAVFHEDVTNATTADRVNVTGTVNLAGTLDFSTPVDFATAVGQSLTLIDNVGTANATNGQFTALRINNATVALSNAGAFAYQGHSYLIDTHGGDGNNVVLRDVTPAPAPSGPTATADTGSTIIGTTLTKPAPGVLVNDSTSDGSALTVTAVNGQAANVGKALAGAYGNLTLNANGAYSYAPDPAKVVYTASVVDHITYTDTANGQTATASLDITVAPPSASTLALFGTVVTNTATQAGGVYGLYTALLARAPDALGLEGFSASIQAGSNLTGVASAILGSTERGGTVSDPTAFVQGLYANALHRTADAGGLQFYTNELNAGVGQATVAVQIATSQEAQSNLVYRFQNGVFVADAIDAGVARLYYGLLNRAPDASGLGSFEGQVKQAAASGGAAGAIQGLSNVATAMLGSPEFAATHAGQTSAAYVDSLYVGALGRHADAAGASYFGAELAQGVSRATVALQIAESAEAQVHLVGVIENGFQLVA